MRKRLLVLAVCLMAMAPMTAMADAPVVYDGRLEGYTNPVTLDGGTTAVQWLLLVGLGIIAIGVMFKNANRSHLD